MFLSQGLFFDIHLCLQAVFAFAVSREDLHNKVI